MTGKDVSVPNSARGAFDVARVHAARGRATRSGIRSRRRGVALLVVLWTITMLATIAALAGSAARGSADVAAARRAGLVARTMAESGIALATARIDNVLLAPGDSSARFTFLDGLEAAVARGTPLAADTLGDGVFAATVVDVSARMDVNAAGREGWYLLLRAFTDERSARAVAARIDERVRGTSEVSGDRNADAQRAARDSLVASLLGREVTPGARRRIESLDDLLEIPGVDIALMERIAPFITVDGNGTINRRAASAAVLAAASGSLVDHPVRLLVVSRGYMRGHPLTREIEAVYDIADEGLRLVRWRERER